MKQVIDLAFSLLSLSLTAWIVMLLLGMGYHMDITGISFSYEAAFLLTVLFSILTRAGELP